MDCSVSAHVQAIPSKSHSDNGPEIRCMHLHSLLGVSINHDQSSPLGAIRVPQMWQ